MKLSPRFGAAHAPSPDVRYGSGLPMSRRRTFATSTNPPGADRCPLSFAHSMLTALRHPACAGQQRRLWGHGQPLTDTAKSNKSPERKRRDLHAALRFGAAPHGFSL